MSGKTTGVAETAAELRAFAEDVAHMGDALAVIAARGVDVMRPLVPVDTGALADTVAGQVVEGAALITAGSPAVSYAAVVNKRVNYVGRAAPAIELLATAEFETGITHRIHERGLDQ